MIWNHAQYFYLIDLLPFYHVGYTLNIGYQATGKL